MHAPAGGLVESDRMMSHSGIAPSLALGLLLASGAASAADRSATHATDARSVAEPAPVVAVVIAPVRPPDPNDDWLAQPDAADGLAFADLVGHVGDRVEIVTRNKRTHRGTVTAADARQVTLRVRRSGGAAAYTLLRDQIVRIGLR